jgi:hypothetical protein
MNSNCVILVIPKIIRYIMEVKIEHYLLEQYIISYFQLMVQFKKIGKK